ncbi:MAG: lamin tail domain-containing protein [Sumerlaeia bacterium]
MHPFFKSRHLLFGGLLAASGACVSSAPAQLIISQVMFNSAAATETNWEFVEVYNTTGTPVDMSGWVLADDDVAPSGANIASGTVPANGVAYLFNAAQTEAQWEAAWADVNAIAVTEFPALGNNGDLVAIYSSFANFTGMTPVNSIDYSTGFPSEGNGEAIYLTDVNLDNTDGANWDVVEAGDVGNTNSNGTSGTFRQSVDANGNGGNDFASLVITGNTPPSVSNAGIDPLPSGGESITFSVDATDDDGSIAAVRLFTSIDSDTGPFTETAMTLSSGDTYTASITAAPTGQFTYFYIEVEDSSGGIVNVGTEPQPRRVYSNANRAPLGEIVINEIMYNTGLSQPADEGGEWIELLNTGSSSYDLSYFVLADDGGNTSTLPMGTTIGANGYLVLADNATTFTSYGPWAASAGSTPIVEFGPDPALNNGGDSVILYADDFLTEYDRVDYSDVAPWDPNADGTGASLELIDPSMDNNVASNWTASDASNVDGSPGAPNLGIEPASATGWDRYQ